MKGIWTEKTEGKTAFQHCFILELKRCEQHQASLCHFMRPSFGLALFSSQAPSGEQQWSWEFWCHACSCSLVCDLFYPTGSLVHVQLFSHVRVFVTPRTAAHQALLSMGFSRQEYWVGCHFLLLGNLPDPGIKPMSVASPASAGRFFTTVPPWEAIGSLRALKFWNNIFFPSYPAGKKQICVPAFMVKVLGCVPHHWASHSGQVIQINW